MPTIPLQEAQTHLAEIIDQLAPGEEILLTRDGKPVATLRATASDKAGPEGAAPLEEHFRKLAKQWRKETSHLSLASRMAAHPAYQEIISMKWPAVPLLLEELRRKPDHWFIALEEITRENPVPPESEGKIKKMAEAWIQWGIKGGYIK